jgi:hypothetical protein
MAVLEIGKNALGEWLHVTPAYRSGALRVTTRQDDGRCDRNEGGNRTCNRLTMQYQSPTDRFPKPFPQPAALTSCRLETRGSIPTPKIQKNKGKFVTGATFGKQSISLRYLSAKPSSEPSLPG